MKSLWLKANQEMIAKSLGELAFEQILRPELSGGGDRYKVDLKSGVSYRFNAWKTVWDYFRVSVKSIERIENAHVETVESAGQFFIDAQLDLGMSDLVLGQFLEEMHSTLFADMRLLEKNRGLKAQDIALWNDVRIQSVLNGHPKILLNKGRMGWGASDHEVYSSESERAFQLEWIAVSKKLAQAGLMGGMAAEELYMECMSLEEVERLTKGLERRGKSKDDYFLMPVHPWQWDRVVRIQFSKELVCDDLIYLGAAGDFYSPQISLRTLSNHTRPACSDIKLPLSILNTSAVRGISARYIRSAVAVSEAVQRICQSDELLVASGTDVFREKAGIAFVHPLFKKVRGSPYRYHELLGAVWRESSDSKLKSANESVVLTGALFHQDEEGQALIGAYIDKSGLSVQEWLKKYFNVVVIPLYHLQLKYGLGLVAHGQNIVLKLKDFVPVGMCLKDFHGDLRLSDVETEFQKRYLSSVATYLDRLPPHYLIHDLVTGHLLTVLRFVSAVLYESNGFSEKEFYRTLSDVLQKYLKDEGERYVSDGTNMLNEKIHRVLLNKVRFKIGYADSAGRPLPMLGEDLKNPLYFEGELC